MSSDYSSHALDVILADPILSEAFKKNDYRS